MRDDEPKAKIFGPYMVHERLGVGGMATVYRAVLRRPDGTEDVVALKRLLPHLAEDGAFVKAFIREAKLSALLRHPNIVSLHELGRVADTYFMSMELVDGRDLRKCLRQARRAAGPPPLTVVVSIARQMCAALDYAHQLVDERGQRLGLVHRDISPSNILISSSGNVKLIDFGIAKATAQHTGRSATIKGKLAYLSPEAVRGEPDSRSDLFSAGVVLYELITARPLFADTNDFKIMRNIESMAPPAPSKFNPKCPPLLDQFVLKALEKDRDRRWDSGTSMCQALDEMCDEYKLHAAPRDVVEWVDWAFALPVPERKQPRYKESDSSISNVSFASNPGSGPTGVEEMGDVQSYLDGADDRGDDDEADAIVMDPEEAILLANPKLSAPDAEPAGKNPADMGLVTFRPPTNPPPIADAPPTPERSARPSTAPPPAPRDSIPPLPRRPGRATGSGVRLPKTPVPDIFAPVETESPLRAVLLWGGLIIAVIALAIAILSGL